MTINEIVSNIAFWTCLGSIILFAYSRFNVSLPDVDDLSPPLQPRSFTTAFRFELAAAVYIVCFSFVYVALLTAGSIEGLQQYVLRFVGKIPGSEQGTPAWAALVATAVLPAIPGFSFVDTLLRTYLQDFASIPGKARSLAREILSVLATPEPPIPTEGTKLQDLHAMVLAHQSRFGQLQQLWSSLDQISIGSAARRYRRFRSTNEKTMDGFRREFSGDPSNWTTTESARYMEDRHRRAVQKAARFVTCAMLEAESTEVRVRTRLQSFGIRVRSMGINFTPGHIILALVVISIMTVLSSFLSGLAYYTFYETSGGLLTFIQKNFIDFLLWAVATVFMYLPSILFAAGVSMYLLDRVNDDSVTYQPTERITAAISTFLLSGFIAFFPILLFNVLQPPPTVPGAQPLPIIANVVPWVIAPAAVATVFMWLSTTPRNISERPPIRAAIYVLAHAVTAIAASSLSLLLWLVIGGDPDIYEKMPHGIAYFLVPIVTGCIGATIGLVLSTTRRQLPSTSG